MRVLVLDSGAFITGAKIDSFGPDTLYVTIPDVINELRDKKTRHILDTFPFPLEQRAVTSEAYKAVCDFAKLTGDFHALSTTDLKVIALGYMYEQEKHGAARIRTSPEIRKPGEIAATQKITRDEDMKFASTTEVRQFDLDDFWFQSPPSSSCIGSKGEELKELDFAFDDKKDTNQMDASTAQTEAKSEQDNLVAEDWGGKLPIKDDFWSTAQDVEGDWITPNNVKAQNYCDKVEIKRDVATLSSVACITTDYAMQNVMLQLGLRLLSVQGLSVTAIVHTILMCHACSTFEHDMSKEFCRRCGSHAMVKARATITDSGPVRYKVSYKAIYNKRGTQYSIPNAKGGRKNKDLKLREDAMKKDKLYAHKKGTSVDAMFDDAAEFGWNKTGVKNVFASEQFGYGRRNPNVSVRRAKDKNKRNHRRR